VLAARAANPTLRSDAHPYHPATGELLPEVWERWLALEAIGVTDVSFDLFEAGHMAIEYRYPLGLRYLAERLG
jgi:hypothetical protein